MASNISNERATSHLSFKLGLTLIYMYARLQNGTIFTSFCK